MPLTACLGSMVSLGKSSFGLTADMTLCCLGPSLLRSHPDKCP